MVQEIVLLLAIITSKWGKCDSIENSKKEKVQRKKCMNLFRLTSPRVSAVIIRLK
jgi:hypothetical protein